MVAMAIGLILLAALYVAMDSLFREMSEGRERVEQSALARSLFQRISSDMTPGLGPVTPPVSSSGASGAGGAGGTAAGGGAAGGAGAAATDTSTTQNSTTNLTFSVGVKGDNEHVSIFLTRLNSAIVNPPDTGASNPSALSDVTRITYFLDSDKGLCRQEILQATSDLVDDTQVSWVDSDDHYRVVAGEVRQFDIQYYDGTNWQSSWDGSTPGPDGKTPQGPPRSIQMTIGLQMPGTDKLQTYTHTISFATAPGPSSQSSGGTTMP
jgi:hypothetical protein